MSSKTKHFSNSGPARKILWAAVSANLFANVSLSGVNVSLPAIQADLGLSAVTQVWVSSSLLLATAAAIAPVARLADIWGRRKTNLLGLAIFILTSIVCSLASDAVWLLSARAAMGLGLAMIFASSMAMAASIFPADKRGLVFGYIVSAVYVGLAMGPGVCGLLVDLLGWQSVFAISGLTMVIPLGLLLAAPLDEVRPDGVAYDYSGALLWALALGLIFVGLTGLLTRNGRLMAMGGLLLLVLFILHQLKIEKPILDVRLFAANRRFSWASLAAFVAYSSAMASIFLLSLFLQYIKGLSAKEAGFYLMLQPTVQALLTPLAGRLSDRLDPGRLAAVGLGITTVAFLMISLGLSAETSLSYLMTALVVFGLGFAIFAAPNSNAVMSSVGRDQLGVASGIITATRLSGQIFSLSLTSLVFSVIIGQGGVGPQEYPLFIQAARFCFMVFTPLCLFGALASLVRDKARPTGRVAASMEPQLNED